MLKTFRLKLGNTRLLATDDTDLITDFSSGGGRLPFEHGTGIRCALAYCGEEWFRNVYNAHFEGLVHARRRDDDRGLLSNTRCAERANVGVWFVHRGRD